MDVNLFISSVFTLTLVMDPLGNIPLFMTALKGVPEERRRAVVARELFIALGIMVFFLFFGKYILGFLALDMVALSVGGGIVLFLIAIQMIFPPHHPAFGENPGGEPFIVPLAVPLVAGPSTLTTILIFSMKDPGAWGVSLGVVAAAWVINISILSFASRLSKLLGARGLLAMEKLMGMILVTISVQMIMTGLKRFLAFIALAMVLSIPASAADRGIYGFDDRKDVFEAEPYARELARSVAAMAGTEPAAENGMVNLQLQDFKTAFSLCAEERFFDQPVGSFCTAALVAPDLLLTAGHCVPSPESCLGKNFVFGFEMGAKGEWPLSVPAADVYSCAEIVASSNGDTRDFAVIRLDRPVAGREPLRINRAAPPEQGTWVFVIGTPLGLPLKVAGGARVRKLEADSFMTDLDTFGGNSGSPVFNLRTGLVEGILIAGGQDLTVKNDICVVSYVTGQDEGTGERVALSSQFSAFIP